MSSPATGKRVALAAVAGAHGVKGELRLKLFSDSIASLARHSRLYVGGRAMALRDIKDAGKTAIACFEEVSDRESAEALRGEMVEIDRADLPPLENGEYYHADLVGLSCFDEEGKLLGSVVAVENFGAGDLLEIELAGGRRSLIPFRDPLARLEGERILLDPDFLA